MNNSNEKGMELVKRLVLAGELEAKEWALRHSADLDRVIDSVRSYQTLRKTSVEIILIAIVVGFMANMVASITTDLVETYVRIGSLDLNQPGWVWLIVLDVVFAIAIGIIYVRFVNYLRGYIPKSRPTFIALFSSAELQPFMIDENYEHMKKSLNEQGIADFKAFGERVLDNFSKSLLEITPIPLLSKKYEGHHDPQTVIGEFDISSVLTIAKKFGIKSQIELVVSPELIGKRVFEFLIRLSLVVSNPECPHADEFLENFRNYAMPLIPQALSEAVYNSMAEAGNLAIDDRGKSKPN